MGRLEALSSRGCALILGAGWSAAVGLPLASELFDVSLMEVPPDNYADEAVLRAFERWRDENPDLPAEKFIALAYEGGTQRVVRIAPRLDDIISGQLVFDFALKRARAGVGWPEVASFLQRRLATPVNGPRSRGRRVSTSELRYRPALLRNTPSPEQAALWESLLDERFVHAVVTTNYDLTAEQTIGPWTNKVPGSPGFYYGGIAAGTHPVTSPFGRDQADDPHPRGVIPLLKLHGSLNWSLDLVAGLQVFPDLRPAFRGNGDAAIVPPLPEKPVPDWLAPVWECAAVHLSRADEWVVVGYSLPSYDYVTRDMLKRAGRNVRSIRIYDPFAEDVAVRWAEVAPRARIELLPGLIPGLTDPRSGDRRLTREEAERRRNRAESDPRVRRLRAQERHPIAS